MRVLGLALAGALVLTARLGSRLVRWDQRWGTAMRVRCPALCKYGVAVVRTGIRRLLDGAVGGTRDPITRGSGTADGFRVTWFRTVLPAGGFAVRGRGCRRTGSWVRAAGRLIIPLLIGEVRPGAGVTRSQPVLNPSGSGFIPPNEISYRAMKLPRVSAAFGPLVGAAWGRFAAGGVAFARLSSVTRLQGTEPTTYVRSVRIPYLGTRQTGCSGCCSTTVLKIGA
jgi:hypothetical protein